MADRQALFGGGGGGGGGGIEIYEQTTIFIQT